jgi:hypothetical protein
VALVIFTAVAAAVSAVVDVAARRTSQAARAGAESQLLATTAARVLRGERALPAVLARVREAFAMDSVTLLEQPAGQPGAPWAAAGVSGAPAATRPQDADTTVPVGDGLVLALRGPVLAPSDLRVLGAFAAYAAVAFEQGRLTARAEAARSAERAEQMAARASQAEAEALRARQGESDAQAEASRVREDAAREREALREQHQAQLRAVAELTAAERARAERAEEILAAERDDRRYLLASFVPAPGGSSDSNGSSDSDGSDGVVPGPAGRPAVTGTAIGTAIGPAAPRPPGRRRWQPSSTRCCAGCGSPTCARPRPRCWPPPAPSGGTPPRFCASCWKKKSAAATRPVGGSAERPPGCRPGRPSTPGASTTPRSRCRPSTP